MFLKIDFFFLKLKIFIIMRQSSYQSIKFYWTYWQTVRLPWTSWTLFFEKIVNEKSFFYESSTPRKLKTYNVFLKS